LIKFHRRWFVIKIYWLCHEGCGWSLTTGHALVKEGHPQKNHAYETMGLSDSQTTSDGFFTCLNHHFSSTDSSSFLGVNPWYFFQVYLNGIWMYLGVGQNLLLYIIINSNGMNIHLPAILGFTRCQGFDQ
jgi:hypothetical protein